MGKCPCTVCTVPAVGSTQIYLRLILTRYGQMRGIIRWSLEGLTSNSQVSGDPTWMSDIQKCLGVSPCVVSSTGKDPPKIQETVRDACAAVKDEDKKAHHLFRGSDLDQLTGRG